VKLVEAKPVIVPTSWEDSFAVHADKMIAAITPKTKAIILNSPSNPTGALIDEAAASAIAEAAGKRGIWVIVDLCYEHLIYEDVPHNLPKVLFEKNRDRTVLACSASKAYAMTGWRTGWTIAPAALTKVFNTIQGQTTSNIASIAQKALVAALSGSLEPVAEMRAEFKKRRDNIHAWLTANPGIQCVKPKGAFYLFPNITGLLTDQVSTSLDFAQQLLEKEHVVVTPGEAFDAPGYLRISYATSMEQLREGADRMLRFADSLQPAKASAS
jgi:aspartate aminotransferase